MKPTKQTVKLLGRTKTENGLLWLAFSGAGVEFTVTAKELSFVLHGDSRSDEPNPVICARYAVYVDGKRVLDEQMEQTDKTVRVFSGKTERTAAVRFLKLSESISSVLAIADIRTDGELRPTAPKKKIEFIGDSITCGYGVDDEDASHLFSSAAEDVTRAFAYQTAALLDMDWSMVAVSGYGVISGNTEDGVKQDWRVMPKYYETVGFSDSLADGRAVSDWAWDFADDVCCAVINLGTNDYTYVGEAPDRVREYVDAYVDFLKLIRRKNPKAYLVCAYGMMGAKLYPAVLQAVRLYREQTGDGRIGAVCLTEMQPEDGVAANGHPTERTHIRAAKELAEYIKTAALG